MNQTSGGVNRTTATGSFSDKGNESLTTSDGGGNESETGTVIDENEFPDQKMPHVYLTHDMKPVCAITSGDGRENGGSGEDEDGNSANENAWEKVGTKKRKESVLKTQSSQLAKNNSNSTGNSSRSSNKKRRKQSTTSGSTVKKELHSTSQSPCPSLINLEINPKDLPSSILHEYGGNIHCASSQSQNQQEQVGRHLVFGSDKPFYERGLRWP
ncbi:unnamed protein product [Didymodactylos carnosus]|uniref:Uncharacterized protein n=1 Tax=Didymodactylos carnosus TaxID=1234261 RepID=A0A815HWU1_9BILA|nr:unnamed protein product [Didymodactylos carnosus]CAF1357370.1 unnamed protein product [Didymodactylos carnosus]CAF3698820.1 unnamed protein product [Didymodactylos carnosus]CAF4232268.1 unnamed protein product [Didymodactylos carnosus]